MNVDKSVDIHRFLNDKFHFQIKEIQRMLYVLKLCLHVSSENSSEKRLDLRFLQVESASTANFVLMANNLSSQVSSITISILFWKTL